jgi:signal transduction histidine kinase
MVEQPGSPVREGAIGELFHATPDAVLVLHEGTLLAANRPAVTLFHCPAGDIGEQIDLAPLLQVEQGATLHRVELPPYGVVDVIRRHIGEFDALILRDVTVAVRHERGLRRIAAVSRALISAPPTVATVLQLLVTEAKHLTEASYSALLLLRPGSTTETSHFVYDAPRHLFPTRMPRVVGLLAVPIAAKGAARLDDIRGHPAGVGLPGVHPPMGPLVAVPLLAGDEVIGELAVANPPDGRVFDETDERLLQDLAAHVVVAVHWAQQAERATEQELARQEVVDTARHDIRTPLGAGKGYAQLLSRKLDRMSPEQVATALDGLLTSFDRIESFSERLLVDQRRELVGVEPQWAMIEVEALLGAVQRDAEAAAGRAVVAVMREDDAPTGIWGDPEMVREVLDNLVSNALKHSPTDQQVVLSVRWEGDHARFDVRDEGPGIAESDQAALFERWSRTDSSRARQVPGYGLGLSIVKRLVVAHDGTLGVSSRLDEGATFWVTFPTSEQS